MKKLYVLPLFLAAIALSACGTFTLSIEEAKSRLEAVVDQATENGKYIGGNYLLRESTRSNIVYDIDEVVVETHHLVKNYFFDIANNYFRLDEVETDVVKQYEDREETKVVEVDNYLYVRDNEIYNVVETTVNNVASDKVITVQEVNEENMSNFKKIVDLYYSEYIDVFEASIGIVGAALTESQQSLDSKDVELDGYGPKGLTFFSTGFLENTNAFIDFRYGFLNRVETFNRNTHELVTESFDYGSFYLKYAD